MKAKMKFISLLGFFVLALSFETFGQDPKPTPNPFERLEIIIEPQRPPRYPYRLPIRKCSLILESQQFCSSSQFISAKLGESLLIYLYLANKSENVISVMSGGQLYDLYKVIVTDPNGNRLPSIIDNLKSEVTEGKLSPEALSKSLPSYPFPRLVPIGIDTEIQQQFDLRQYYDFKTKGKYLVQIERKVVKQDGSGNIELSLGAIEVEIK
ncbi:MAG: hypothetical protein WKF90_15155 [Pyrinomonadaceae bacterium]